MKYEELSSKIINVFYRVYNALGYGFLENVYENAMLDEFAREGIVCNNQCPIEVIYNGKVVGRYLADFFVEGKIVVELKAVRELLKEHENQLVNYLAATNKEVGLLLNFGKSAEVKRKVYDNEFKKYNFNLKSVEKL